MSYFSWSTLIFAFGLWEIGTLNTSTSSRSQFLIGWYIIKFIGCPDRKKNYKKYSYAFTAAIFVDIVFSIKIESTLGLFSSWKHFCVSWMTRFVSWYNCSIFLFLMKNWQFIQINDCVLTFEWKFNKTSHLYTSDGTDGTSVSSFVVAILVPSVIVDTYCNYDRALHNLKVESTCYQNLFLVLGTVPKCHAKLYWNLNYLGTTHNTRNKFW